MITYVPSLNFSAKRQGVYTKNNLKVENISFGIPSQLTRLIVLEQTMKVYDPNSLLSPCTLIAKMLLHETWTTKLQWDDALIDLLRRKWVLFFEHLFEISTFEFD